MPNYCTYKLLEGYNEVLKKSKIPTDETKKVMKTYTIKLVQVLMIMSVTLNDKFLIVKS